MEQHGMWVAWQILFYGWATMEVVVAVRTRTRHGGGEIRDRGTLRLLWIVISTSITVAITFSSIYGPNMFVGAAWFRALALATLVVGMTLRLGSVLSLGKAFSSNVAIREEQRVKQTGLYRFMRHPSYTGMLIVFLATGLFWQNWIGLLIVVIPTTVALLYRIHVEEIALRDHFGEEYVDYSRKTSRLIPGIY